jgi:hypothetical protein
MVPHVQHAGLCGTLLEFAGHLLEFAGHCGTPLEGGGGDRRATPTITMASESILLRDDTWHQRSLVIAASNTPPQTLSTCFRRGGGVF